MDMRQVHAMAKSEYEYGRQCGKLHGILTARGKLRKQLPDCDYVYINDEGVQVAGVYLGTLINPSGKYYMPFACSNVEVCPRCKGEGCDYCGQLGSREAFEDSIFWEYLEEYASRCGACIEAGEGDPCDTFMVWYGEEVRS